MSENIVQRPKWGMTNPPLRARSTAQVRAMCIGEGSTESKMPSTDDVVGASAVAAMVVVDVPGAERRDDVALSLSRGPGQRRPGGFHPGRECHLRIDRSVQVSL